MAIPHCRGPLPTPRRRSLPFRPRHLQFRASPGPLTRPAMYRLESRLSARSKFDALFPVAGAGRPHKAAESRGIPEALSCRHLPGVARNKSGSARLRKSGTKMRDLPFQPRTLRRCARPRRGSLTRTEWSMRVLLLVPFIGHHLHTRALSLTALQL